MISHGAISHFDAMQCPECPGFPHRDCAPRSELAALVTVIEDTCQPRSLLHDAAQTARAAMEATSPVGKETPGR